MAGYLDIVDEDDRVIGSASSEEVHAGRLLHRFVQVFVVGSDGRILIQQRSRRKARGPLLLDASIGGHVDSGETYDEAAIREGAEELGLRGLEYRRLGRITDRASPIENMLGILYEARSDGPFSGWEEEAERIEWMTPEELGAMVEGSPHLFTGCMPQSYRLWRQTSGSVRS